MQQLGKLTCPDILLVTLADNFQFPDEFPEFKYWVYRGNGSQIQKFFSMVKANKSSKWGYINGRGVDCVDVDC